jgi:hypothetical protein
MSEVRIARFVDMKACKSIFSDYSTFVLRSSEYYRREYETDRGDERELEVRCTGGGLAGMSSFVLSCWTKLDGDEPTRDEWSIFPESIVAIVSMPSKVYTFLEKAFEIEDGKIQGRRRFPFMFIEHKAVTYADEVAEEITFDNIMDITVFTKRLKFAKQKEYRFALPFSSVPHVIDSYIFAKTPDDYMEKCFANPGMSKEDKETLRRILANAMCGYGQFNGKKMGEIIVNVDILF